jgi:hypothetical protein
MWVSIPSLKYISNIIGSNVAQIHCHAFSDLIHKKWYLVLTTLNFHHMGHNQGLGGMKYELE